MKIHVGCGRRNWADWYNVDAADYPHVHSKDYLLSGIEERADVIYSSHFLEYFTQNEAKEILNNWRHALTPYGELRIAVPDFDAIVKLYSEKEYELSQFLGLLYGQMEMNDNKIFHKTVYNFKSLCKLLAECGFKNIGRTESIVPYGYDDHSCAVLPHMSVGGTSMSLNVIATK